MTERDKIIIANSFTNLAEVKKAKKALAILSGCPESLIDVYVKGYFKIPNRSMWTNELDLSYKYEKVNRIGKKYISIYVASKKKNFKAEPDTSFGISYRKPRFKMFAESFTGVAVRYQ